MQQTPAEVEKWTVSFWTRKKNQFIDAQTSTIWIWPFIDMKTIQYEKLNDKYFVLFYFQQFLLLENNTRNNLRKR